MELWIRSQNKSILTKVNSITSSGYETWVIKGWIENEAIDLGKYDTEKRALEVLDEIAMYLVNANIIVYDMPAE